MKYLIAREWDDSLVTEVHGSDDDAEQALTDESLRRTGTLLLFRDQRLMAHATDGVLTSYREPVREEVAA